MTKVFISYSHKDIELAKKLTGELQKNGIDFWIDWEGVPPPAVSWMQIEKNIEEADVFLFLVSPDSAQSKACGQEIDSAVKNGKRLIPLIVREVVLEDVSSHIRYLDNIFFRASDNFDASVKQLLAAIQKDYKWVATHRRLQVKALEWERNNRENKFFLWGRDLHDAEVQLATNTSKEPHPTDLQREYVLRCREATDRQRRINTGVLMTAAIVLAALAVYGFVQAQQARTAEATAVANQQEVQRQAAIARSAQATAVSSEATAIANEQDAIQQQMIAFSRQLAAQAQSVVLAPGNSKQPIGILLALQSMKIFPVSEASQVLLNNNPYAPPVAQQTHDADVTSITFSPDGKYVVTGSNDGTTRVWDATSATTKEVALMIRDDKVYSIAFSPDGKYIVSGGNDYTARVWEVATGNEVTRVTLGNVVYSVAFSPDGKYVASGSGDNTARVWEAATGKEIARMTHDSDVYSLAFSSDGKYVVSGSTDGTVRVWEAATGKEDVHITHGGDVYTVAFSPYGRYVASGGNDGTARVWEVSTGKEVARMTHDGAVKSVAFSPDSKYVVSGSDDYTARVWEAVTGVEVTRAIHDGGVKAVAFSPNGKYVASGSSDNTARVWIWRVEDLMAGACAVVPRNLTRAEWKQYIGDVLPYQAVCDNLPIEPDATPTP